jgi:hypothetical protein
MDLERVSRCLTGFWCNQGHRVRCPWMHQNRAGWVVTCGRGCPPVAALTSVRSSLNLIAPWQSAVKARSAHHRLRDHNGKRYRTGAGISAG